MNEVAPLKCILILTKINEDITGSISILSQTFIQGCVHTLSDPDSENKKQASGWSFSCN